MKTFSAILDPDGSLTVIYFDSETIIPLTNSEIDYASLMYDRGDLPMLMSFYGQTYENYLKRIDHP